MSDIPKHVTVGPITYDISVSPTEHRRLEHISASDLYGVTEVGLQRITLNPHIGPDVLAETLLHEVLHACMETAGLSAELEDGEEAIVRRLSPTLLQVLRDNPKLVRWLSRRPV